MLYIERTKRFWTAALLAITAGIVYNSWPLGYWLNPVVAQHGLASELEAVHQPYDWIFILLDVISGLLVLGVVWLLWRRSRELLNRLVLVNFGLFGFFTIVDALMPMTCDPSIARCPSLSHQPMLILHGIASILASVCLFVSAVMVWYRSRHHTGALVMSILMAGWALFGVVSVIFFFVTGPGYLAQHYYITLCSLWTALLPFMYDTKRELILYHGGENRGVQ